MITSPNNERIKAAARLHRRRFRAQTGTMLIEGLRLVRDAWLAGVRPRVLFFSPELIEGNPATIDLVQTIQADGVDVVPCSKAAFDKLADTVTPQGIAALIMMPALQPPKAADLILLLDRVRDPGNAGTLLRSAEAAGAQMAIFCPETVDPFNDKVMRAGMGAHFRLPILSVTEWAAVPSLLPEGIATYLADATGRLAYDAVDWSQASALIIGGEAAGASMGAEKLATAINIPMAGGAESLNAGVAGSIILFEANRQRRTG